MVEHVKPETMLSFLEGGAAEDRDSIIAHLAACPECGRSVADIIFLRRTLSEAGQRKLTESETELFELLDDFFEGLQDPAIVGPDPVDATEESAGAAKRGGARGERRPDSVEDVLRRKRRKESAPKTTWIARVGTTRLTAAATLILAVAVVVVIGLRESAINADGGIGTITLSPTLYRGDDSNPVGDVGMGLVYSANLNDDVSIRQVLPEGLYFYLIRCDTDGEVRPCLPSDENSPPEKRDMVVYPPEGKALPLEEGVGLQAFVLLASRDPLPPYSEWRERVGDLPWKTTEAQAAWSYSGGQIEQLGVARGGNDQGAVVPEALKRLFEFLKENAGDLKVSAIAFPVEPKSNSEGRGEHD